MKRVVGVGVGIFGLILAVAIFNGSIGSSPDANGSALLSDAKVSALKHLQLLHQATGSKNIQGSVADLKGQLLALQGNLRTELNSVDFLLKQINNHPTAKSTVPVSKPGTAKQLPVSPKQHFSKQGRSHVPSTLPIDGSGGLYQIVDTIPNYFRNSGAVPNGVEGAQYSLAPDDEDSPKSMSLASVSVDELHPIVRRRSLYAAPVSGEKYERLPNGGSFPLPIRAYWDQ